MRASFLILLTFGVSIFCSSQNLKVSENGRFLVTENNEPFFWMADTAWELFHRCTREEVDMYLAKRKSQGFNVIQAVALAELNGLNEPNRYGQVPLIDNNPAKPNSEYFRHIDYVIDKAESLGMYIALLPTWGDKVFKNSWGTGPEVFTMKNSKTFGKWIGSRYKDKDNIIWVIGGDRNPRNGTDDVAIWNEMAEGIAEAAGGYKYTLMTFHPQPDKNGGSSQWFHEQPWLDFNMHQTGHCANQPTYQLIKSDYELKIVKPVLDGEPLYEDHPNCFNAKELGYSVADDIRRIMYWNVFAGAFGQTYGCHDVWQMYTLDEEGINGPLRPWQQALDLPMANQVKHLKNLFLSRPFLNRVPDNSIVLDKQEDDENYVIATRDNEGSFAMVYFPTGHERKISISNLKGNSFTSWWFDPRTGNSFKGHPFQKNTEVSIHPPSSGKGNDWVLVVDTSDGTLQPPGKFKNQ
ncbi:Putative collagen-binding domain of a collagenase [Pricia antarctica]|uniref:Putative collagen-binding domain of a collagenase n=1 Tax=Pricia antarctica TaxID=641691 RepID=A0A1G7FX88_9FLAO|nr:glycoside hydrolase family 140 protein [Pricia antarctica]SDE80489.1 Putative collagen-binding domain of a collagenase [Pricia antarctica]